MPETKMHPRLWQALQFAVGYLNLGLPDEALQELDILRPAFRNSPEVLSLRTQIHLLRSEWVCAAELAESGRTAYPELPDFFIQQALAYEQLGQPARAIEIWKAAPPEIRRSGFCHYNMARCEARLGNLTSAQRHALQAMKLEPSLKPAVRTDPLLCGLQHTSRSGN